MAVGCHATHVQIFDADSLEGLRQVRGQLMRGVAPDCCHTPMHARKSCFGLAEICRTAPLARKRLVGTAQPLQRYCMRLRANDGFAGRERGKCGHAEINTDLGFRLHYWFYIVRLNLESNEPTSSFT